MNQKIVKIEDTNFLAFLKTDKVAIALCNEKGEPDLDGGYINANAEIVLDRAYLEVNKANKGLEIKNLAGIEVFANLVSLTCTYVGLEKIPSLPPKLKTLNISNNRLKRLPTPPETLTYLDFSENMGINVKGWGKGIKKLFCRSCGLEELPNFPSSLQYVECNNNNLRKLPKMQEGIMDINCDNNAIEHIDELPNSLESLYCSNNKLTKKPKHPDAYIECKGNNIKKKKKKVSSYFAGKETDNYELKLAVVNELIKRDEELLHKLNTIVENSNIRLEILAHGYLYEIKELISELKITKKELASITSLTFSRNNDILYLLDPDMEEDVDDYDIKSFKGIEELKHLEMIFFESGISKAIDLKPLYQLKNVKKIDKDYFSKALFFHQKIGKPILTTDTLENAYNTIGNVHSKLLSRSETATPWGKEMGHFSVVYTENTTVVISNGFHKVANIEFYIEVEGTVPFNDLKYHFLIAFLNKTINYFIQEDSVHKTIYTNALASIQLYFDEEDDYKVLEEESEDLESYLGLEVYGINALLGIDSPNVPSFLTVNHKNIGLVGVRPLGEKWIFSPNGVIEEGIKDKMSARILLQLNLTYDNYFTPNYYPQKNTELTHITSKLNDLYFDEEWDELAEKATNWLDKGYQTYKICLHQATGMEYSQKYSNATAIDAYQTCLDHYSGNMFPNLYNSIASLLSKEKEYEKAIVYYNLYLASDVLLGQKKFAFYERGMAYYALGNYEPTIADLTITYDYRRSYENVNLRIAECHIIHNKLKEAFEFIKHDLYMQKKEEMTIALHLLFMIVSHLKGNEKQERRSLVTIKQYVERGNTITYDLMSFLNQLNKGETFNQYILDKVADLAFEKEE